MSFVELLRPLAGPLTVTAACVVLTATGCARAPYYYQPPYAPTPVQTLQPGQPYVPGAGFAPGGGFAPSPAVSPGTTGGFNAPLQPIPSQQTPPSTFDPNQGGGSGGTGGATPGQPYYEDNGQPYSPQVPNYPDSNSYGNPSNNPSDDFLSPSVDDGFDSAAAPANPQASTPAPRELSLDLVAAPMATPTQDAAVMTADAFDIELEAPAADLRPVGFDAPAVEATRPMPAQPYAFDQDGYTWLRGLVSFDNVDKAWTITYDTTPDQWDNFAGHLTLAGDIPPEIRDNDIVLVEGAVDQARVDRFGKPVYRIGTIAALERE